MNTHYDVLELDEQATPDDIRRAYRRLVQVTHPDRTPDPAQHRRYLAVNEAYETLSDPARRQRYDAALRHSAAPVVESVAADEPHPDPAMRRRGRTRVDKQQSHAENTTSYAAQYARYMPSARWVNRVILIFSVMLIVDSQWSVLILNQPVRTIEEHLEYNKRGNVVGAYFRVTTPELNFRLEGDLLKAEEIIDVECSALFRQVRVIYPVRNKYPDYQIQVESFYDALLFLPILMGIVAVIGCWPLPGNRRIVDTAVMAIIMAVIHVFLLLRS